MEIIKEYVEHKKHEIADEITTNNYKIKTVVVQVGDNKASNAYIKGKLKDCAEVGIECELKKFDESITEEELIAEIEKLNNDNSVDGFIVQLPLPKHISEARVTEAIDYHKDIDGFTKLSLVNPATPQGIITYLEDNNFKFENANAVVIGRSNIVGRPIARMLLDKNCNVTVIHSRTTLDNKQGFLKNADLVVVATGKRNTIVDADLVTGMLSIGSTEHDNYSVKYTYNMPFIVDVGINRNEENKLCGDCESVTCTEKTSVPGGVGLITRLALILNIIKLYKINHNIV